MESIAVALSSVNPSQPQPPADRLAAPLSFKVKNGKPVDYFPCPNALYDVICGKLGPLAWAVYSYLLRHCDRTTGRLTVDHHTIATEAKMSVSSVKRAIAALAAAGFLLVQENRRPRGKNPDGSIRFEQFPNTYFVAAFPADLRATPKGRPMVPTEPPTNNNPVQESESTNMVAVASIESNGTPPESLDLRQKMEAAGVPPLSAARLVRTFPAPLIAVQLDCLPDRAPRNPVGTLIRSIENQWSLPQAYIDRQNARELASCVTQRAEKEQQARHCERAAHAQQEAAHAQEAAQLDALWEQLSPETRARIEATVKERLGVLGRIGKAEAAKTAMRRNVQRELLL